MNDEIRRLFPLTGFESESLYGIAVAKIFLQPNASVPTAIAQVTSVSQAVLKQLPTDITPPLVLSYSATNVPVLSVGLSGGKQRTVEVDLDYKVLQGYGLTPFDVVNTINAQNLTLPSGTQKIGLFEYQVGVNASPNTIEKLNAIPIKTLPNGTTVYIRDVTHIRNGSTPQTNVVRFNGKRAVMLVVQKSGNASTLDIVHGIKDKIPSLKQTLPPPLNITTLSDQSIFVTGAIEGLVREK